MSDAVSVQETEYCETSEELKARLIHDIEVLKKNKSGAREVCKYKSSCDCSECMTGEECRYHKAFLEKTKSTHSLLDDYIRAEISYLAFHKEEDLERKIQAIVNRYYKSIYSYAIDLLQFDKAEKVLQSMKSELIQLWYVNNINYNQRR